MRTLRFDIKSAVSSRVNWLIWSIMLETLGSTWTLVVDSHLLEGPCKLFCDIASGVRHSATLDETHRDTCLQACIAWGDEMDMTVAPGWNWEAVEICAGFFQFARYIETLAFVNFASL